MILGRATVGRYVVYDYYATVLDVVWSLAISGC